MQDNIIDMYNLKCGDPKGLIRSRQIEEGHIIQ